MAFTRQPTNKVTGSRIHGYAGTSQGYIGAYIPKPIHPHDWHTKKTATAVVKINTTLAELAERKAKIEKEREVYENADPATLTPAQLAKTPDISERTATLFHDAMKACDQVIEVLDLVREDAGKHAKAMSEKLAETEADWIEKMVASGHYHEGDYDPQKAGGIGGWFGANKNSLLITAARAESNAAGVLPRQIQEIKNHVNRGCESNAEQIREYRAAQVRL